ncbi:glycosyltransferase family 9 protein [Bradyrhizobium sp. BWC-3-1]|uniref:glycosyltransferase family 9 protein n=1 Tax=Bradyrhizobium sp. BWC-3-1 TaxID=3080012 RepID=UPI00293ECEEE|nr:glycosyltransferase family 9 protein [Bradyrhizobium sp. BWC-3-1]WOH56997.1 glycosyltransferase family 9 protein [Bradyrhizobium sp. BWC-3-1]
MNSRKQATCVFFSNGVGDHVLCLPALRALGEVLNGEFVLAYPVGPQGFIFDDLKVHRTVQIPFESGATFEPKVAASLIGKVDRFVSLTSWMSPSLSGLISELRPTWSLGFFPEFQRQIALDFGIHSADLAFQIPRDLTGGLRLEDFSARIPLPEEAVRKAIDLRIMMGPGTRILAVHNETRQRKMWDAELFESTIRAFLDSHSDFVALSIGMKPANFGHDRIIECNGILPLSQSFSLVAHADYFLGVDSCMLHVADFARVPSVGLFGPTNAREFGFRLGPHITIQALGGMEQIRGSQVSAALESIVENSNQRTVQLV